VQRFGAKSVIIGGGVSANRGLRAAMQSFELPTFFPAMEYCTDNAAMIAGLGDVLLRAGRVSDLSMDAVTQSSIAREAPDLPAAVEN
jgi:tRNA A37 threonylcarbamoyltransferase TsaD